MSSASLPLGIGQALARCASDDAMAVWVDAWALWRGASPAPAPARRQLGQVHASRPLGQPRRLLHGDARMVGRLPAPLMHDLVGRQVHSFAQLRRSLWRSLGLSAYAPEFGTDGQRRMAAGLAPAVSHGQRLGGRRRYELHHLRPVHQDPAGLYDLANLLIVTPAYHHVVLHPQAHYRRREVQPPRR